MNAPHSDEHSVDRAVREHLTREMGKVDAEALLARVKAGRADRQRVVPGWVRYSVGAAAGLAVAAAVTLAFVLGGGPEPRPATAAELVREAQVVHAAPTDRCYDVAAEWNRLPLQRLQIEPMTHESKLWTRGDQFWISGTGMAGNRYAWGQGKDGRVWIAYNRRRGMIYDKSEAKDDPLTRYADLMSLRAASTLGELLEQYELFRRDTGKPGEPIRIEANFLPRPARPDPRFRHVELELDPLTKVIRKALLRREVNGETVGTLTFTLAETGTQPDEAYELKGHLEPNAVILDGPRPVIGPMGGPGLRPPGLGPPAPPPRPGQLPKKKTDEPI